MNEVDCELYAAAADITDQFPGADFSDWADNLMRQYPAEVVDALGTDERDVEERLKIIWRDLSPVGRV